MTKQEIREGIWQALRAGGLHISEADDMLETIWAIVEPFIEKPDDHS